MGMKPDEAQQYFREAEALYRQNRAAEALEKLTAIDRAFPNNLRVLLSMALCHERLGEFAQGLAVCARILRAHKSPEAREIRTRLRIALEASGEALPPPVFRQLEEPGILNQRVVDLILDDPKPSSSPPLLKSRGRNRTVWFALAGLAVAAMLLGVWLLRR
jgi:tetratricopeptide (TPR) repeat protein